MTITPGTKILLDTDGIIAFVRVKDILHSRAQTLVKEMVKLDTCFCIAATTLAEAVTTLRRKFSESKLASGVLESALRNWEIISVDGPIMTEARKYYVSTTSRKDTLFDAINIAVMKRNNLGAIFSFDSWYKKHGIKLASDLV